MLGTDDIVRRAADLALVVPAFNVPYLPMIKPVIQAVVDANCFALVETARLEWIEFGSVGPAAVMQEFIKWETPDHVRIHLDHVPVIDEDGLDVDYLAIVEEALSLGYQSIMIDGSHLGLEHNIRATRRVAELAHRAGVPCEAELGSILGHQSGSLPPYPVLFETRLGFTDVEEAGRFVEETACDWLSVAIGSVHGAVYGALKDRKKIHARLDLDLLHRLRQATGIPLVLHGGSGIRREDLLTAVKRGIAKVNIASEIRRPYESALRESDSIALAQAAVYERTTWLLRDYLGLADTRRRLLG